jgi:SAM-dependent methyltransferase
MRFEKADVRALPFDDGALGGAVAFYSLIHLDDIAPALTELRRVIRVGGLLCVAVHGGEGEAHVDDWFGRGVSVDARFWSLDALVAEIDDAGFAVESAVAREPYPEEGQTTRLYVIASAPPGSG